MKRIGIALLVLLFSGVLAHAAKVKTINLAKGRADDNTLKGPVLKATAPLEIGAFVQDFPPGPLYRFKSGGVIGGRDKATAELDLGKLLATALQNEARPMGFQVGPGGWRIEGRIHSLFYDLRTNGWAVFSFLTLCVDLDLTTPQGEKTHESYRIFDYRPGMSLHSDEAIAVLLVEGSQDILARLNVRHFKFPPDPSAKTMMDAITATTMKDKDLEVASVGLSGSPEVVQPLLDVLPKVKDENDRSLLVNALARLLDERALPVLTSRYRTEDEDVRWFTLKALGNLGTKEAMDFIRAEGIQDKHKACKALAEDILSPTCPDQPTKEF